MTPAPQTGGVWAPAKLKWSATPGMIIAGQAAIDGVDVVAREMERKWGADRLRLLVSADLREKFDRQRYLTNQAIWHGDLADVQREAQRMINAWRALDRAADAAGAQRLSPRVIETATNDGTVIAIVADGGSVDDVSHDGRKVAVWTLDEVANVMSEFSLVNRVKTIWPGAAVVRTRQTPADPLEQFMDSDLNLEDEIPF